MRKINRLFVLSFENKNDRKSHSTYYLPKVEIKDCNVTIDGRNFFDQRINSMSKTYENIREIATGKGGDYTTGCLLDYPLDRAENRTLFFLIEEAKETIFEFSQGTVKVL